MDTIKKEKGFLGNISIYFSASIVSTSIALFTLPIFTRYLSPADYGILALFTMFGLISSGLLSIGISRATYRYYFKYKQSPDLFKTLNSTNMLFLVVVYLFSFGGIFFLSEWFSEKIFNGIITGYLIQLAFLSGCLGYIFEYMTLLLSAQKRPIPYAFITISLSLFKVLLSLYFIFFHSLTYMALIYSSLITNSVMIFCLYILLRKTYHFKFSFSRLKESFLFSYPLLPRSIIGHVYESFDKIMLNKYTGLTSLGYYTFGARFADFLKLIKVAVDNVWGPFFLEKAHENNKKAKIAIVKKYFQLSFILVFIGLGIIFFSEEAIKLLTTKEFYFSMFVVPIYIYFYLFGIIGWIGFSQLMFAEKMIYLLVTSVVSIIINVILNILLIPSYGAIGAAIATAIAALGAGIATFINGQRVYPLPIKRKKILLLFSLLILFTIPIYLIFPLNIHFIFKICIKIILLFVFFLLGIKMKYISEKQVKKYYHKVIVSRQKLFGL